MKMDSTIMALNSVVGMSCHIYTYTCLHTYIHVHTYIQVGDADRHLNEVQNNVSTKINHISSELYSTVKDLNEAVS